MITENTRKQLADYRKHGKKLKYLINYLMGLIDEEDDFENIIIREMKALAFNEDEIVECLEYHLGYICGIGKTRKYSFTSEQDCCQYILYEEQN